MKVNFLDKINRHVNESTSVIKVLNLGDVWVNNLMFKYENDVPIDVCFLDLQISFYSSPGIYFVYFLTTSPTIEMRQKQALCLKLYYDQFKRALIGLGCSSVPSIDVIKSEINSRQFYGNNNNNYFPFFKKIKILQ